MTTEEHIHYLENQLKKIPPSIDIELKYRDSFERYARQMYDGVYTWCGVTAKDTRELFLEVVLLKENIKFKSKYRK